VERQRTILGPLLVPHGVVDLPPSEGKREVVERLGRLACESVGVPAAEVGGVLRALWEREQVLSTGIGLGIAIPHVRNPHVGAEVMRVGRSRAGLPFDAIDGKPVHVVFTILMPAGRHRRHVEVLGAIAAALKDEARRAAVYASPDAATFVQRMLGG
jgi:mannitol/fructose-specific phosphotransferase system IIA component (Ntr-type)